MPRITQPRNAIWLQFNLKKSANIEVDISDAYLRVEISTPMFTKCHYRGRDFYAYLRIEISTSMLADFSIMTFYAIIEVEISDAYLRIELSTSRLAVFS